MAEPGVRASHAAASARSRLVCAVSVLVVIALGLASRRFPALVPDVLGKYPGDALWTVMVFFIWAMLLPRQTAWRLAVLALATSFAVEFFQLVQAPWAVALRSSTLGRLALGTTFGWTDLIAYTVGAALAWLADGLLFARQRFRKA